jgi:hypothetical protein
VPSARGLANGIFSWGVYYGYGLAYVVGIYLTQVISVRLSFFIRRAIKQYFFRKECKNYMKYRKT